MIIVRQIDPRREDVSRLIAELDLYNNSLYPAESNHHDPVDVLVRPNVYFVGALVAAADGEETLLGIGAVKRMAADYGEIKRMYVPPAARGRGIGKLIMAALEEHLRQQAIPLARLETGVSQTEALSLYEKFGYKRIGPFGDYQPDPLSVFMEKRIAAG